MTPETLAKGLLTPADLGKLGISGLVVIAQQNGTASNTTGSGFTSEITFVSGDRGCKSVLNPHTPTPQAWAYVGMASNRIERKRTVFVNEDIESFAQLAEAQQVMQENLTQLANCHTFVGKTSADKIRWTFAHWVISVPAMGEDAIAHQLDGVAGKYYLTLNFVEVRSGTDVVFIGYQPSQRGVVADTAKIAAAAMRKYSKVRE